MGSQLNTNEIRTCSKPECILCGCQGQYLYRDLRDRIFSVPGKWDLKQCPSPKCGMVWLDPMPLESDIGKAYKIYHTHQDDVRAIPSKDSFIKDIYNKSKTSYLSLRYGHQTPLPLWDKLLGLLVYLHLDCRAYLDANVFYLHVKSPMRRLLEIGCGNGQSLKMLEKLGWQVEGLDFDPAAVKNAKSTGLKVHLGTLKAQQYSNNYFDAVTMKHLIEHVHDPLPLLQECYRILKPGGKLVVITPNIKSLARKIFKDDWRGLEPPRHLHIFTPLSMQKIAETACFKIIKGSTINGSTFSIFLSSMSLRQEDKIVERRFQPLAILFLARAMQFLEWCILKFRPNVGEEIVLIAEK